MGPRRAALRCAVLQEELARRRALVQLGPARGLAAAGAPGAGPPLPPLRAHTAQQAQHEKEFSAAAAGNGAVVAAAAGQQQGEGGWESEGEAWVQLTEKAVTCILAGPGKKLGSSKASGRLGVGWRLWVMERGLESVG